MWESLIITPFVNVLLFIYSLVGNMGIAIILFTLLIRLVTHPLMVQQIKGAQAMQSLQTDKRYIEMQTKYKGDKERLAQEQMKLYKELKINPFASCLPLLIQFPIIIGLYQSLMVAVVTSPMELLNLSRHLYPNFLSLSRLIPLKSQFLWMEMGLPEIASPNALQVFNFAIPILAIVVVITTYMQSKLMQTPNPDPKSQSNMMTGMMNIYMPFLMGWMAYTLSSGLALYFVTSNLIGIGQYALLGKVRWSNLIPGRKPAGMVVNGVGTTPTAPQAPKQIETKPLPPRKTAPLPGKTSKSSAVKSSYGKKSTKTSLSNQGKNRK